MERGQVFSPPLPAFHPSPMPSCLPSQFGPAYDAAASWNRFSAEPRLNHSNWDAA